MADVTRNFDLNPFASSTPITASDTVNVGDTITLNLTTDSVPGNWTVTTQPSSGTVNLSTTSGISTVATYTPTVAGTYPFTISFSGPASRDLNYTATVEAAAVTGPDPFTFPNRTVTTAGQTAGVTSTQISGLSADSTATISSSVALSEVGFAVNSSPTSPPVNLIGTNNPMTVSNGDYIHVQSRASTVSGESRTTTVTINGVSASTITTYQANIAPSFSAQPVLDPAGQPVAGTTFGLTFTITDAESSSLVAGVYYNTTDTNVGGTLAVTPTPGVVGSPRTISGILAIADTTRYYFVRVFDGTNTVSSNTVAVTPTAAGPTGPSQFTIQDVTDATVNTRYTRAVQITGLTGTADVTWSTVGLPAAASGVGDGFFISSTPTGSISAVPDSFFTTTTKQITGGSGQEYVIVRRISSASNSTTNGADIDINGVSDSWRITTATPADTRPTTPTTFTATPSVVRPGGSVTLAASGSTDSEGDPITYQFRRRTSTDNGMTYGAWSTPSTSTTFAVPSGATAQTIYQFQARATAGGLFSDYTPEESVNVDVAPSFTVQPSLVGSQPIQGRSFSISFTPFDGNGSSGLTAELLYNTTDTTTGGISAIPATSVTSGVLRTFSGITAATAGTTRYYFVRLSDGVGTVDSNTVTVTPTVAPPVVAGDYGIAVFSSIGTQMWGTNFRNEWFVGEERILLVPFDGPGGEHQEQRIVTVDDLAGIGWTLTNSSEYDVFFVSRVGATHRIIGPSAYTRTATGFVATFSRDDNFGTAPAATETYYYSVLRF